jgi:hypothetical protein
MKTLGVPEILQREFISFAVAFLDRELLLQIPQLLRSNASSSCSRGVR